MANRYGRQQKKKHRARIAELETALIAENKLVFEQRRALRPLQDSLGLAVRVLGRMHPALPARSTYGNPGMGRGFFNAPVARGLFDSVRFDIEAETAPIELEQMVACRPQIDPRQMHMLIHCGDGRATYALSKRMITTMDAQTLGEIIAKELAPLIANELKGICR